MFCSKGKFFDFQYNENKYEKQELQEVLKFQIEIFWN